MAFHAGTSGFSYSAWKGEFYPAKLKAKEMLRYYAERFNSVEINNTFYKMPEPSLFAGWKAEVPKHFVFALKAPQTVTHHKRLKDADAAVKEFFSAAAALGARRGPVLFQLPPNFKKDTEKLKVFLGKLPRRAKPTFEFRHLSWFEDDVFNALRDHGAALCWAEADDFETPHVSTAGFAYVRLRKTHYTPTQLRAWAKRLHMLPVQERYVFFKHEDTGTGPRFATSLLRSINGLSSP